MSPKTQPNGQGDIVQVAGSSTDIEMIEANAGTDVSLQSQEQIGGILDATAGRDVQHRVQSEVALSPDRAMLEVEVSQLRDHLVFVQGEAESYGKAVKASAMDEAKAKIEVKANL